MSYGFIKQVLEIELNNKVTTIPIKWYNSTVITLNKIPLTQIQIDNLKSFVEPRLLPISQDRELLSADKPIKYEAFFNILIYTKKGNGSGLAFDIVEELDSTFREITFDNVIVDNTEVLGSFEDGDWVILPYRLHCYYWNY